MTLFARYVMSDPSEVTRTKHTYRTNLYQFVRDILVACPKCDGQAIVRTGDFDQMKYDIEGVRVVCAACGFNKQFEKVSRRNPHLVFGAPVDPFFKLPVRLQIECCGQLLWAYNLEHLAFLQQHVEAKLRERNGFQYQVRSIGARLPRWMTAAKNRAEVLKAIEKLQERIFG